MSGRLPARAVVATAVFAVIAASRWPFLTPGYGVEIDAWRVANTARSISHNDVYEISRFPGYPAHEIVCSWFWRGGPIALNGTSALMALLACAAVWSIARKLNTPNELLLIAALAATPAFYVSSVTTKDYVWALAFSWLALRLAMDGRAWPSGILLGLATGCRLTAAAMFLPVAIVLWSGKGRSRSSAIVGCAAATAVTALICFLPVLRHYGSSFLLAYAHARPDAAAIIERATLGVWGGIGSLALAVGWGATLIRPRLKPAAASISAFDAALLVIIAVYSTAYLMLPDQSGYLLPLVPAVLLLLARFAPERVFQSVCIALVLVPFIDLNTRGLQAGAILADHRQRERSIADVQRFVQFAESALPGENLIVVGGWQPLISALTPHVHNHYIYLATAAELHRALERGWRIAYTSRVIRDFNYAARGVNLDAFAAIDLQRLLAEQQTPRPK
jgi:hypothetical protein